jgi:hypothetical protein
MYPKIKKLPDHLSRRIPARRRRWGWPRKWWIFHQELVDFQPILAGCPSVESEQAVGLETEGHGVTTLPHSSSKKGDAAL